MEHDKKILFIDEDVNLVLLVGDAVQRKGMEISSVTNITEAETALDRGEKYDFIVMVIKSPPSMEVRLLRRVRAELPECAVIVLANHGAINDAIIALRNGATDYLLKPVRPSQILFALDRSAEKLARRGIRESFLLGRCRECTFTGVVAASRRMKNVCHQVGTVANSNAPILLQGEAGVGKELFVRTIHCLSQRRLNSYIKVSCGTSTAEQLDAQLFGVGNEGNEDIYATDTQRTPLASGGTIHLDEVAEMPMPLQAKLMQTLQDREFQSVDGVVTYGLDVRFISTSGKNLEDLVEQGKFREDLYYKLNVVSVTIPALRKHKDDIMPLAEYFLDQFVDETTKKLHGFSEHAEQLLVEYDWPGNVRDLRNAVERAVIHARGTKVEARDLPEELHKAEDMQEVKLRLNDRCLDAAEEALIERVLFETKGNISKSADMLGISRGTLYNKLEKYQMRR